MSHLGRPMNRGPMSEFHSQKSSMKVGLRDKRYGPNIAVSAALMMLVFMKSPRSGMSSHSSPRPSICESCSEREL